MSDKPNEKLFFNKLSRKSKLFTQNRYKKKFTYSNTTAMDAWGVARGRAAERGQGFPPCNMALSNPSSKERESCSGRTRGLT